MVLCSLFEEQESLLSPTYNNSNRLTDNSAVTEENVSDLLRELEAEYPSFDQWNTDRSIPPRSWAAAPVRQASLYAQRPGIRCHLLL